MPPEAPYPTVVMRVQIDKSMGNRMGNLHGGCTATIFDDLTSMPLMLIAREGAWQTSGVSRNLSVMYLKAIQVGEEVEVISEVVSVGARLGS